MIYKGRPLDYVDKSCRDWITCNHCNKNLDSTCDGTESYSVQFSSSTNTYSCASESNNSCAEARCQCDLNLVDSIISTVSGLDDLTIVENVETECVIAANSDNGPRKNQCCGSAPFYEKYSLETHVCNNGVLEAVE